MVAESQHGLAPRDFAWDDARVLLALVRAGTFRGAAARLAVNASTVGRRLDALEAALGARLFDRTPDGVLPTAAAERLVAHAERLEQAAAGLASAAEGFEQRPEGVVRLTAPPGVAEHFIAPALPRLHARHPGLRVDVDASIAYADLTRREADIALRATRPESGDLVAVKVVEVEGTILAAPAFARAIGSLRAVADARWITWGPDLAHIPTARWVAAHVPERAIALRTSSIGTQVAAAEAGLGVLLLARAYAGIRGLVEVRLAPALRAALAPTPREALWMVGHRALREVPRIDAVWRFVLEEFAGGGRGGTGRRKRAP
jgi:DNA-binding transcriptional LysR family regulator